MCIVEHGGRDIYSWGRNDYGQLGLGHQSATASPTLVQKLSTEVIGEAVKGSSVILIAAGTDHSACVTLEGRIHSWGRGLGGRLGLGDLHDKTEPCAVVGGPAHHLADQVAECLSLGGEHSCVVTRPRDGGRGRLFSWGGNSHGQLGHGNRQALALPTEVGFVDGRGESPASRRPMPDS